MTPARKPRPKKRTDFARPAHVRLNHPVPHRASDLRQCVPLRASIVYASVLSLGLHPLPPDKDGRDRGSMVHNASIARVARATAKRMNPLSSEIGYAMPLRTVAHCLDFLVARGLLERSETHSKNSPVGTSYRVVPWAEVQQKWRDNPEIGNVGTNRNTRFVWGKGLAFLTPRDIEEWMVDVVIAEKDPRAQASAIALSEPPAAERVKPPAPPAAKPRRLTVEESLIEDTAIVHRAILDNGVIAEPEHAAALLAIAREVEAAIPAASVAMLIHELSGTYIARERKRLGRTGDVRIVWTVGWYSNDMAGAVHAWKNQQDAAQRATGTRL